MIQEGQRMIQMINITEVTKLQTLYYTCTEIKTSQINVALTSQVDITHTY
jgi:hypothetical protein